MNEVRLVLSNNYSLTANRPKFPQFELDEIEVWIEGIGEKHCIFKDSFSAVFPYDVRNTIDHLLQNKLDCIYDDEFDDRISDYFQSGLDNGLITNYILFDHFSSITWIMNGESIDCAYIYITAVNEKKSGTDYKTKFVFPVKIESLIEWIKRISLYMRDTQDKGQEDSAAALQRLLDAGCF